MCIIAESRLPAMVLQEVCNLQGCGLGRDVSVLRRSRDVLTSRLGLVLDKILNVLVSSRSRTDASRISSRSRSNMSRSRPSRSRLGSWAIVSR